MQIKKSLCAWLAYIKTMESSHWVVGSCGGSSGGFQWRKMVSPRAGGVRGLFPSAVTEYPRLDDVYGESFWAHSVGGGMLEIRVASGKGLVDVGCPSVCCEYVSLSLVNEEADLTNSQAE